ncbi:hypothetical protein [Pseudomonas chlororaphis]|uniref:hypothetical protein n=1 Tax=Pseudomonas chlororaphis TaxID=587753 RepID=UPI003F4FF7FB
MVGLNLNGDIANSSASGLVIGNKYTYAMGAWWPKTSPAPAAWRESPIAMQISTSGGK